MAWDRTWTKANLEMLKLRQDHPLCKLNVGTRQQGVAAICECYWHTLCNSRTLQKAPIRADLRNITQGVQIESDQS